MKIFNLKKYSSIRWDNFWNNSTITSYILCFISSFLLILSYPKFDFWGLAWIGLVPLMFALDGKKKKDAFKIGYVAGILFFSGTLYWFVYSASSAGLPAFLGIFAVVPMVLYLALYWGFFAVMYVGFSKRPEIWKLALYPCAWVVLEFIRDRLFTGFGWVSLGHSQYLFLPLIQIADVTGVFGVSFLVVLVNYFFKTILTVCFSSQPTQRPIKRLYLVAAVITVLIFSVFGYGVFRFNTINANGYMKVAVVQGSIPQKMKWVRTPQVSRWILRLHYLLTEEAAKNSPDLVVWPEASFPEYLWENEELFDEVKSFVNKINIPLLIGIVTREKYDYHNSAFLISENGEVAVKHHKLYLVPFGEYIPLRKYFPWILNLIPITDFSPGKEETLFPALIPGGKKSSLYYSVLICFEDTVSSVVRRLSNKGAHLLVNMTNDAWFHDTKEPFLHLQAAVFQAVQNRRTIVRAANTGISCFINQFGQIYGTVRDADGKKTYIPGLSVERVALNDTQTFYTKFGDVFTYLCFGCILMGVFCTSRNYNNSSNI
jgi:apolipoprotein N-acyltransferase